jgi:3-dehydroquinate synthase
MQTLHVELGKRRYPIYIGQGILDNQACFVPHISGKQAFVVSNETVAPLYLGRLKEMLSGYRVSEAILPDGESWKTLDTLKSVFDDLLSGLFARDATLIALGGGVVGDIGGFAAACYQRGIPFIQVPTTLLAQVDSSVGGKTGVNHPLGKNMIGAFYQPQCVVADCETLNSLPDRELSAGLAEVIKYGLIFDRDFYAWIEAHLQCLLDRQPEALAHAIERSCSIKAKIVSADEKESGIRAILNLGHTFGHAIESHQGYGHWLHGEAVAAGMVLALKYSVRQGFLAAREVDRLQAMLKRARLPISPPEEMDADSFLSLMRRDKKVQNGKIRLVLLKSVGEAVITADYDEKSLIEMLGD